MPLRVTPASGPLYRRKEFRIWPEDSNINGGRTRFTDPLTTPPDELTSFITSEWQVCFGPDSGTAGSTLDGLLNLGVTGLTTTGGGTAKCAFLPTKLSQDLLSGANQYSQITVVSNAPSGTPGAGNAIGPGVCIDPNRGNAYWLCIRKVGLAVDVFKSGSVSLASLGTIPSVVAGDTLRIEAALSVGFTTIRAYLNGTLQGTFVDAVGPISYGMPGIYFFGNDAGVSCTMANYDGGLL